MAVIEIENACYRYAPHLPYSLEGLSLKASKGERWLIVGENGSGKSTLLYALGGLRKVKGKMLINGKDTFEDLSLKVDVALVAEPWPEEAGWAKTVLDMIQGYGYASGDKFERFLHLCSVLHVDPYWRVDHCSSGMKRRIQLLLGLFEEKSVLLLDEVTPDLDEAERHHLLEYLKRRTEEGVLVLYSTHIFDQLEGWATHIVHLAHGRVVNMVTREQIGEQGLQSLVYNWIKDTSHADRAPSKRVDYSTMSGRGSPDGPVIRVTNANFHYGKLTRWTTPTVVLEGASFSVPRGARVILFGTNGSGKSTLLRLLAGRHFIPVGEDVSMLGRHAFHDPSLVGDVGFSGTWFSKCDWDLPLSQVIYGMWNVPDAEREKIPPLSDRAKELLRVLDVDLNWSINSISSGQRVRAQIFLNLMEFRPVLLLDEITAYLDVVQRLELLEYLRLESEESGCTIVYSTHIFEGMQGWPTHLACVDGLSRGFLSHIPVAAMGKPLGEYVSETLRGLKEKEWANLAASIAKASDQHAE